MPKLLDSGLTIKQNNFVESYLISGNALDAVIHAYESKYPDRMATQLLKNPRIVRALESARAVTADRLQFDRDSALMRLIKVADHPDTQPAQVIQAVMGAAKIAGFVVDKREISGQVSIEHHAVLASLSVDDIRALAAEARATHQLPEGAVTKVEENHDQ